MHPFCRFINASVGSRFACIDISNVPLLVLCTLSTGVVIKTVDMCSNARYIRSDVISKSVTHPCCHFEDISHQVHIGQSFNMRAGIWSTPTCQLLSEGAICVKLVHHTVTCCYSCDGASSHTRYQTGSPEIMYTCVTRPCAQMHLPQVFEGCCWLVLILS